MTRIESVARSGDALIDGLLDGSEWAVGALTYGNPRWRSDYGSTYVSDADGDGTSAQDERFSRLRPDQLLVVQSALDTDHPGAVPALAGFSVEGFTLLNFDYAGPTGRATLRFANTGDADTAYATPPGYMNAGDVWFGEAGGFPAVGNYDLATILHEIGHALGLKHPHERGLLGRMPVSHDSPEFSVMSYRDFVGADPHDGYQIPYWDFPQSFMMLDIAALQHMYGANFAINSGDTVYAWSPGRGDTRVNGEVALPAGADRIFATIWDGGGTDTYDLSDYRNDLRLDLRAGHASVFSGRQLADLGGGPNDGLARGNIFNALRYQHDPRSLIENAIGGAGDDRILGNAADNHLRGGDGRDTLRADFGTDLLCGGRGDDTFLFRTVADSRPGTRDTIAAGDGAAAFQRAGLGGGDVIDVSGIDADTRSAGDQAFKLGAGTGRGHLWLEDHGKATWVCGDTDGDATVEFRLAIRDWGVHAADYAAGDFVL